MEETLMQLTGMPLALIGYGLAAIGGGVGVGLAANGATQAIARQPEMYGRIFTIFIMGAAMAEALALIGLLFVFMSL
ncbi:MAG: ATP synthase F0 subunit C [Coriobacteriia bacterium]|nr:ATP synthase F0 subunit C [Coriobacteriia bacterium]MCL2750059.1 ATP synthase F0 subunit C [Coriobacteriia bacterium]